MDQRSPSPETRKKVDLILPFYRPHEGWAEKVMESVRSLKRFFDGENAFLHLYVINDGSPAGCYPESVLQRLRESTDGNFDFLSCSENHGKGFSLRYGVSKADGEFQIYTDGDFPFGTDPVIHAWTLLNRGDADVVMGVRDATYANALCGFRKTISGVVRKMNRILLGLPDRYCDTQAGFKAFNAKGRAAFLSTTVDTFVFDTEFILLSHRRGLRIEPVPLNLRPGLHFSRMGLRILLRELVYFTGFLTKIRVFGCRGVRNRRIPE